MNTLGRWMAHHLAELILEAQHSDGPKSEAAQTRAVDLILKLWANRQILPGNAYPLNNVRRPLAVLEMLGSDILPFGYSSEQKFDRLLIEAFHGLRVVILYGVLQTKNEPQRDMNTGEAAPFLVREEICIVEALNRWIELFKPNRVDDSEIVIKTSHEANVGDVEFKQVEVSTGHALPISPEGFSMKIADLISTLTEMREYLASERDSPGAAEERKG